MWTKLPTYLPLHTVLLIDSVNRPTTCINNHILSKITRKKRHTTEEMIRIRHILNSFACFFVIESIAWMQHLKMSKSRPVVVHHPLFSSQNYHLSDTTASPSAFEENVNDTFAPWQPQLGRATNPYRSPQIQTTFEWIEFLNMLRSLALQGEKIDPFWEQIKFEARDRLQEEPEAGPQLYQGILSQPDFLTAICTIISHEIETELISATQIKDLFLRMLTPEDEFSIRLDLEAVTGRSLSADNALSAMLFDNGYHALVCYRVGHRLWKSGRTGLAYYMQSTVSRKFSADIHPACQMGYGIFCRVGSGVVIGETAVVGNDVSILEGVTLGGTGKDIGNRHPKIGNGVIIQNGGTILGNIPIGDGSVIQAKSIVTKPIPPLAIVSGVPAKIINYRVLDNSAFDDCLQSHLAAKYLEHWRLLSGNSDIYV